MNENIIPYVPIADRVKAKTEKSQILCKKLFGLIDRCVQAQFSFNHDTEKGQISICPDQINDLINEFSKSEQSSTEIDINVLKSSLPDLIYPMFKGEHTIYSPIWNNEEIRVWQFQLNQIAQGEIMEVSQENAELMLDCSISALKIWRQSLEAAPSNREVIYQAKDLIYKLTDLELKLQQIQSFLEK